MSQPEPDTHNHVPDLLEVDARTHRRTALVELRGELDLATVPQVAEMLDGLASDRDGVRHIVLDLRSWAPVGCVRLIRQHDYARQNRHNLAVVRGPEAIERLLALTAVQELLVLVDDPADLVPRPSASPGG